MRSTSGCVVFAFLAAAVLSSGALQGAAPGAKPYREWTLAEIKAGVTEKGDEVHIAYDAAGFPLSTMTAKGADEKERAKVGLGRSALSRVFVVPAVIYDSAKVRVSVDPDAKKDRVFTVRLTRYNDGLSYGGRAYTGMVNVEVDFDKADKRKLDGDVWEVSVPIDMGAIADFVWGGDMYGTWLLNKIREDTYKPRKGLGNYLDFEVLPRLLKHRNPHAEVRTQPDAKFKNAITVHGASLHRAGVSFEAVQSQVGNVFASDEKPETSVKVEATAPGSWALRRVIRDAEGNVLKNVAEPFSGARTFTFDLSQKTVGWYQLDFILEKNGRAVMDHRAAFALLPPDTRKEGIGEGPYGSWARGGYHYCFRDIDKFGPLFLKAGLRRAQGVSGKTGHPYKLSPEKIEWKRYANKTTEERIAGIRKQLDDNPNVKTCLMFAESAPWAYQQAWELSGQKVPDPTKYGDAGWIEASSKKGGMEGRRKRFEWAMEQGKFLREHFPEIKITIGNSSCCTEIIAEQLRQGLPKEYVDYMGIESYVRNYMPEREGDMGMQSADLLVQLAKIFGCDKWRPNASYESGFRFDSILGRDRQAAWQVRDVLVEQAWGFPDISIATITDVGNSYYASGNGLCYRAPTAYPKPDYVAVSTVTRLLDQVVSSRRIPCGDECVYVNEYTRKDGACVTAIWTSRGTAEVSLEIGGGDVEYVDIYGREFRPLRNEGGRLSKLATKRSPVIQAGEQVRYIVSRGPAVRSASVGTRKFPGWDREAPGSRLIAKTDDVSAWRVESTTNSVIEATKGPIFPYRTFGHGVVRGVVDEERGPCLELELVDQNMSLPTVVSEYMVVELKNPIPIEGEPASLGAWVKGNSGWGRFYWVIENEKGERNYSAGMIRKADFFDNEGDISMCYTGWNFIRMAIDDRSSKRNITNGTVSTFWRRPLFGPGKLKIAGFVFDAKSRPLFLTERRPCRQVIRVGGIYAFDYPDEGKNH